MHSHHISSHAELAQHQQPETDRCGGVGVERVGQVVEAAEGLAEDRVVRLLGDGALAPGVERRHVPPHDLHQPVPRALLIRYAASEQVTMGQSMEMEKRWQPFTGTAPDSKLISQDYKK